jgi:selenocysteine lyase/cysteine desulfurase
MPAPLRKEKKMSNDPNLNKQAHELLDPLMDCGILSREQCDSLCNELAEFLNSVRAEGKRTDENYWRSFQQLFDFTHSDLVVTPMNAANLCPEPSVLLHLANILRLQYNTNVSQQIRMDQGQRVWELENARTRLARGLRLGSSTNLAIVRNASEGNNAISCGYRHWDTNPGERQNVVLWEENHPTNLEAWHLRADWRSANLFEVRRVTFPSTYSDLQIEREFTSRITDRTRFVSFSETANSTGFRIPEGVIRNIWAFVQQNSPDCHVHVDGTMSWGARSVDLSNPPFHSYVSSAHKWFLGPKETGILYVHPTKAVNFTPSIYAYDYKIALPPNGWRTMPNNALRFEMLGQRDDVNIITLAATQMMWDELESGNRNPYQRVVDLAQHLKQRLAAFGWRPITPPSPARSAGVVRVEAAREGRQKSLYNWLYEHPDYHIAGSGGVFNREETFRLCPHIYNTMADVDSAVEGMNRWRQRET